MKVVGIVAEYNPFHNGHRYQIDKIREELHADYIIVVMSGDYVQRGTCAIFPKQIRTELALQNGVDAVFELPICYATASAEFFAYGAVCLLNSLGIVDIICFGSECGDLPLITTAAHLLNEESSEYKAALIQYQKQGLTYPKARAMAVYDTVDHSLYQKETILNLLSSPNNILGIEYVKALLRTNSTMKPYTIIRDGSGYHSLDADTTLASATAIRNQLLTGARLTSCKGLSQVSIDILTKNLNQTGPVVMDDFSNLLYYKLTMSTYPLIDYLDVSKDLASRIEKLISPGITYSAFVKELKTRQWTETRIWRCLLHVLLEIKTDILPSYDLYARLLGFRKSSTALLRHLQDNSKIPVITKVADAKKQLDANAYALLSKDIQATHLYQQIVYEKYSFAMKDEYTSGPVII